MRVASWYSNRDVRIEEMPVPDIGPDELLMKVMACGICGSDVMEWYRLDRAPLVLGHEIAGEVVEVGESVDKYKVGDRIAIAHHVPCNTCHYCLSGNPTVCETLRTTNIDPGGFAEYVRVPAINVDRGVFALPDDLSYEDATFIEPLACVLRGQRRANLKPGQSVLVIGSGISGLLHIKLAKALGSGRITATDVSDFRLEAARRFGADITFHADEYSPDKLRGKNDSYLADLVIVCTGAISAVQQALSSVERGGTILLFAPADPGAAVPLSINTLFWRTDITLTTSYAGSPADYMTALELLHSRRVPVSDMITHRLKLEETGQGFRMVAAAGDSIKVIVRPHGDS
ncbi:MAG TPA: alcohol dehydrogenase catalytic domain-containing protein [Dehalococcoidia bacterium]|nr:alcohol dehydrogenase catalytic domain-containing protein [Dehalococcoidia bacterium]